MPQQTRRVLVGSPRPSALPASDKENRGHGGCLYLGPTRNGEREKQKREVYSELVADLATQKPEYTITLVLVVVGELGIIGSLQAH